MRRGGSVSFVVEVKRRRFPRLAPQRGRLEERCGAVTSSVKNPEFVD
jgi:hypothetical protein